MTDEERAFWESLEANPAERSTWLVFADWLDERDDQRAAGIRALVRRRRIPLCNKFYLPYGAGGEAIPPHARISWEWWHESENGAMGACQLPEDWLAVIETPWVYKDFEGEKAISKDFHTFKDAVTAACLGFLRLPPERQVELLVARPLEGVPA